MTEVKRERKGFKMKEGKGFLANFKKIGGMDLWMYAVCAVLVGATVTTGAMSNDLMAYILWRSTHQAVRSDAGKLHNHDQ